MITIVNCVFVALGGMIGSVARYLLGLIPIQSSSEFPFITFCINLAGAFVIGMLAGVLQKNNFFNPHILLFLKVGVCGGFTTFSTFSLESLSLMQHGHLFTAAIYILLSVLFGIVSVLCGEFLVKTF